MVAPKEVRTRVKALRHAIGKYRTLYHEKDESPISPEALDSLKRELAELEATYPELVTSDSPTQRIAGKALPELKKIRHAVPQWSLNDAFTEEDIRAFDERVSKMLQKTLGGKVRPTYTCELKIDGLHIILTYEKGILVSAATRGDGVVGEDVTHNIRTIASVPEKLSRAIDIIVEGEVYLTRSGFAKLNKEREKNEEPLFANPRNAAAGSVRQLDPAIAANRPLEVFLYDIDRTNETIPSRQTQELSYLEELGFPINPHRKHVVTIDEVIAYWKHWQNEKVRGKEDYQLDGVVVKVEEREYQEVLGHTGKGPRYAIALKFPAEQVTTVIENITLQVGRTGKLTPVAHLKPVSVAGSTVARATLHNEDFIQEKDIRIGDTVILQKAGDVIPEIVQVLTEFRTGKEKPWKFPTHSTLCGGDGSIERIPGEAAHRCAVRGSFGEQLRKVMHFAGKSALDIEGMGKKTVELLMEKQLVSDFDDVFELTSDELDGLPGFAALSARNLVQAIQDARSVSLDRLLVGLSIPHVGEETALLLARTFPTIDALTNAREEKLASIKGVGDIVARSVTMWFEDVENQALIKRLATHLVIQKAEQAPTSGPLGGQTIVITGTLAGFSREEAAAAVRKAGGLVASSVSRKTSFVLAGEHPGSKFEKATELGVSVLGEAEFKKRIGL
ncbi:MAG: NAD-dependent DNA ligase LigA [Minisyncoccia bacterium]